MITAFVPDASETASAGEMHNWWVSLARLFGSWNFERDRDVASNGHFDVTWDADENHTLVTRTPEAELWLLANLPANATILEKA